MSIYYQCISKDIGKGLGMGLSLNLKKSLVQFV